jgi:ubiquinone/menaquinone biosynthesis C-methylase UbiE
MITKALQKSLLSVPHLVESYQHLGSLVYLAESLPLQLIHRVVKGTPLDKPPKGYLEKAVREVGRLFEEDADRMRRGDYPLSVLQTPQPRSHFSRLAKLYWDSVKISWRRRNKKSKEFSKQAKQFFDDVPEYYQRNFHHQTDGYLSAESAELYDHQVDILFRGTASAMRRMILWGLRDHAQFEGEGEGLKILELACGNGSATIDLTKTFPKAKIVSLDLSAPYLSAAKSNLKHHPRVSFVQSDAADTDFKDETFDAVVSVFLFHELPIEVREKVLKESLRLVKTGGYVGMVDSIQMDDVPELNFGLEVFPREFHEPFFKNYVNHSMEDLFQGAGLRDIKSRTGFVSKLIGSKKPEQERHPES